MPRNVHVRSAVHPSVHTCVERTFTMAGRTVHEVLELDGLSLKLSVARPLSRRAPLRVLYVLDPEPELFALTCAHIFGRYGYDADEDERASHMRRCAIVGVGHDPSLFDFTCDGWDVAKLRELRRAHFLRDERDGFFRHALIEHAVPRAEALLGCSLTSEQRAVMGCSLSSLAALRTLLRSSGTQPRTFDVLVLGSPSLPLCPALLDEARDASKGGQTKQPAKIMFVTGEAEADPILGNGIPAAAKTMAGLLTTLGHQVSTVEVAGEDHGSLKPSLVSRGLGFAASCWQSCGLAATPAATL
jgi:hypothetical protein